MMDWLSKIPKWLTYVGALVAVLTALGGLFALIPGDQPDGALQWILDAIAKVFPTVGKE